MRTLTLRGLIVLLCLTLAGVAVAKPPAPETSGQAAARLTRLGIQLQKEGRHLEAIRIFDDALGKVPHVKIRYYKMRSYHALGRAADARAILVKIIDDPALQDRRSELEELRNTLDQSLRPSKVSIVTPGIDGASVFLDDVLKGKTPCVLDVVPGGHHLKITADGYSDASRSLKVSPGDGKREVSIPLLKKAVVPDVTPTPKPAPDPPNYWLPWTLIGAGGVSVLGSTGFWVQHLSDADKLETLPEGYSQSSINRIMGSVTAGLGVALIVTGVLLLPDSGDEAEEASMAPTVGAVPLQGGGAVFIGGRF